MYVRTKSGVNIFLVTGYVQVRSMIFIVKCVNMKSFSLLMQHFDGKTRFLLLMQRSDGKA
jgi:hypothetical protein